MKYWVLYLKKTLISFTISPYPLSLSLSLSLSVKAQQPPDYWNTRYWLTYPGNERVIKVAPDYSSKDTSSVDVFFVHATTYTMGFKKNGSVRSRMIRRRTELTLVNQLAPFAGLARIYAPTYRQAKLSLLFKSRLSKNKAPIELAYSDVSTAFDHYLENWNRNRPIIVAAHGQGSLHAQRLINEKYDQIGDRLIYACIPGYAVPTDSAGMTFLKIPPCKDSNSIGCYTHWSTVGRWSSFRIPAPFLAFDSTGYFTSPSIESTCHNPLTWQMVEDSVISGQVVATIPSESLRIKLRTRRFEIQTRPKGNHLEIRGHNRRLFNNTGDILHVFDYNLFYSEIRKNTQQRIDSYYNQP